MPLAWIHFIRLPVDPHGHGHVRVGRQFPMPRLLSARWLGVWSQVAPVGLPGGPAIQGGTTQEWLSTSVDAVTRSARLG
jgi:hypothetical protein